MTRMMRATCPDCNGAGGIVDHHNWGIECDTCRGTGLIKTAHRDGDFHMFNRGCGCPAGDPHLGDCRGYREPTKDDYLDMYERNPEAFEEDWY